MARSLNRRIPTVGEDPVSAIIAVSLAGRALVAFLLEGPSRRNPDRFPDAANILEGSGPGGVKRVSPAPDRDPSASSSRLWRRERRANRYAIAQASAANAMTCLTVDK